MATDRPTGGGAPRPGTRSISSRATSGSWTAAKSPTRSSMAGAAYRSILSSTGRRCATLDDTTWRLRRTLPPDASGRRRCLAIIDAVTVQELEKVSQDNCAVLDVHMHEILVVLFGDSQQVQAQV